MRSRSSVAVFGACLFWLESVAVWRAAAQDPAPELRKCWEAPVMTNILEIVQSRTVSFFGSAKTSPSDRAILALSSGDADAAYSAGLLVGWGQTGTRPQFSVVSGVGASALIAPFAFLGEAGDQDIGDLFNCTMSSFGELASMAAARLDKAALAAIAEGHRAGRRLYLVAPASDAHPAVVWNAGLIAASGDPKALARLRRILAAVVDRSGFLEPGRTPLPAGAVAEEDEGLRLTGAGGWFFVPQEGAPAAPKQRAHYFLINNGKLGADENRAFMEFVKEKYANQKDKAPKIMMTTSFGVFSRARRNRRPFHFASVAPSAPLTSRYGDEIDFEYSQKIFMRAWKMGHTGGGWRARPPGLER
jgi:hypothetical protein